MLRIITFIILIQLSFRASAVEINRCSKNSFGFLGNLKKTFDTYNKQRERNLSLMKKNDKTSFEGDYHTVSSCGVFKYIDPIRGGDQVTRVVNKVNKSPGEDVVNFNIKNRSGTMSGKAPCATNAIKAMANISGFRSMATSGAKGIGMLQFGMHINAILNNFKHVCSKTKAKTYSRKVSLVPHNDAYGGLFYGKRRFPGVGTFGPGKEENNIGKLCGELRGNIMLKTYSGANICLGYSGQGADEITVYLNPSNQVTTQRIILRKKSAFNKYPVPGCNSQEWLDTRWATKWFGK